MMSWMALVGAGFGNDRLGLHQADGNILGGAHFGAGGNFDLTGQIFLTGGYAATALDADDEDDDTTTEGNES